MSISDKTLPQRNDGPGWREWALIVLVLAGTGYLLTHRAGAASVYLDQTVTITNMIPVVTVERTWTLGLLPYAVQVTTINYTEKPIPNIFPTNSASPTILYRPHKHGTGKTAFRVWTVANETYALPAYVKIKGDR